MLTENQGLIMLAGANPVPDSDTINVELEAYAYLATLEQRSSEMVQLETRPTQEQARKRPRLVLAMAAFAAVVLIGLVTILNQGDDTPPPATEPTPTTQAVQETTAAATPTTLPSETVATTVPIVLDPRADEALATATAFIEAMATNDFATAETHALDEVMHSLLGKFSKAFLVDEVAFKDALGWNIAVQGCTVTNPDPANTRLTCSYSHSTDISRASGVGPYAAVVHYTVKYAGDSYFGQTIEDTTVVQGQQDLVEYADLKVETFDPFMAWIEANHNDDLVTMWYDEAAPNPWLTGDQLPSYARESIDLWRQYSAEYIAQLDG